MVRLKREDWLQRGLMLLVDEGPKQLKIDRLCKLLQVTKGSFYHHFKGTKDFHHAVLAYWEEKYTSQFITISEEETTVEEQIKRLQLLVEQTHGTQEVTIRAWAQIDPMAREFQERVDQRRLAYLRKLYTALTKDSHKARIIANLIYTSLIGSSEIMPPLAADDLRDMFNAIRQLIPTQEEDNGNG